MKAVNIHQNKQSAMQSISILKLLKQCGGAKHCH